MKTLKKRASNVAHNRSTPFFSQSSPAHIPELIFHFMNMSQDTLCPLICWFTLSVPYSTYQYFFYKQAFLSGSSFNSSYQLVCCLETNLLLSVKDRKFLAFVSLIISTLHWPQYNKKPRSQIDCFIERLFMCKLLLPVHILNNLDRH